jgi:group I intron endonuclease
MKIDDNYDKCAGIYIITNLINGKKYVGESMDIESRIRSYRFPNGRIIKSLKEDIKLYGKDNFDVDIRYMVGATKEELLDLEEAYNTQSRGHFGTLGKKLLDDHKAKISTALKGNTHTLGYKHTPEHCEKLSTIHKGKKHSAEHITNWSLSYTGFKHSPETRLKMSAARMGKPQSPETIAKRVATMKRNKELKALELTNLSLVT